MIGIISKLRTKASLEDRLKNSGILKEKMKRANIEITIVSIDDFNRADIWFN